MAGNSQRRGRTTGAGKKTATAGTGGKNRRALALEQRQAARARKDFAAADAIRDQLKSLGVQVEDTAQGTRWELSR